jgi:hypothetical protein
MGWVQEGDPEEHSPDQIKRHTNPKLFEFLERYARVPLPGATPKYTEPNANKKQTVPIQNSVYSEVKSDDKRPMAPILKSEVATPYFLVTRPLQRP